MWNMKLPFKAAADLIELGRIPDIIITTGEQMAERGV